MENFIFCAVFVLHGIIYCKLASVTTLVITGSRHFSTQVSFLFGQEQLSNKTSGKRTIFDS